MTTQDTSTPLQQLAEALVRGEIFSCTYQPLTASWSFVVDHSFDNSTTYHVTPEQFSNKELQVLETGNVKAIAIMIKTKEPQ